MTNAASGHEAHMKKAQNLGILDAVARPLKVVFLGAGSGFFQPLFTDIVNIPGAERGEMAIVDIDEPRLELAGILGAKIIAASGKGGWSITKHVDYRTALEGADYIVNCIEVSGTECVEFDNDIPLQYGVDQCIGDTTGPGGIFKALRTVPVFLEVLREVEKRCPRALVLNYTNPMSILCLAASRVSKARLVGLCHSVQGTGHHLAEMLEVPYQEIEWECAGINHLAWFTKFARNGEDLYPELLRRSLKDKTIYEQDPVRFDMMRHFGYFITESSGHLSEYLPYYRKRPDLLKKYTRDEYRGGSGFYAANWPRWRKENDQRRRDVIAGKLELKLERSWEYASFIIEAVETNNPFVLYGNVPNTGLITNLPNDNVCEVACVADRRGITPTYFGKLPGQCAAICDSNLRMFDLAADACIQKSKSLTEMAMMLDPLTAAVCSPAEIREMTRRLFRAEAKFLKGFR